MYFNDFLWERSSYCSRFLECSTRLGGEEKKKPSCSCLYKHALTSFTCAIECTRTLKKTNKTTKLHSGGINAGPVLAALMTTRTQRNPQRSKQNMSRAVFKPSFADAFERHTWRLYTGDVWKCNYALKLFLPWRIGLLFLSLNLNAASFLRAQLFDALLFDSNGVPKSFSLSGQLWLWKSRLWRNVSLPSHH